MEKNKEKLQELKAYLQRSNVYDQSHWKYCAVPLGIMHFGKISFAKVDNMRWQQQFKRFGTIFGVTEEEVDRLYTSLTTKKAFKVIDSWINS